MGRYLAAVRARVDRRRSATLVCNDLTGQFDEFGSAERLSFCTDIVVAVAEAVAVALAERGVQVDPTPVKARLA
jgi:hypothetical protein